MALKAPHQKITHDDINFRCNEVATAGRLVVYSSVAGQVALASAQPTDLDVPAGLLLQNVVNRSVPGNLPGLGDDTGTTDLPRNLNRNQTNVSGVVRLLKIGETQTDQVDDSPIGAGSGLYVGTNGKLSSISASGRQKIGVAMGAADSDGFVKVFINIA